MLLRSGYRQVDTMTVLFSDEPIEGGGSLEVTPSEDPRAWTSAYLRSFYGNEELTGTVEPMAASFAKDEDVTLLESRAGGEVVGAAALFRTPGMIGAYCVGTVPERRKQGVATGLLSKAKQVADAEARVLILQTLASDGVLRFYMDRGFEVAYDKLVLEKSSNGDWAAVPTNGFGSQH